MSDVVSVKVPSHIKRLMKKYSKKVNWSQRIREFIINEIKRLEAEENLSIAISILEETKDLEEGIAEREIRDARDNN